MVKKSYAISTLRNSYDEVEVIVDRWLVAMISITNENVLLSFYNRNDRGAVLKTIEMDYGTMQCVEFEHLNECVRVTIGDTNGNLTFECILYKWENLGDVNYFAYGGSLVRDHWTFAEIDKASNPEILMGDYDVVYAIPSTETGIEDHNIIRRVCVDVFDKGIDTKDVLYLIGYEKLADLSREELVDEMSPELLAREIVEAGYATEEDMILTDEEFKTYLRDIGFELDEE